MKRIRGGRGLGDSIYLRPIAEHFIRAGWRVVVMSDYADVFLGSGAGVEPFGRRDINVHAHYTLGKSNPMTNQWQDVCASAGVKGVPLSFAWSGRNTALIAGVKSEAAGRPIVLVHGGREPMERADKFGAELLPRREAFDAVLAEMRDCFTVQIGKAEQLYPLATNVNLNGGTTVSDLLDLACVCDGVVAQCSFAIPLAEVFDKPLLVVWAAAGLASRQPYIRTIAPFKVLSKPRDQYLMDDRSTEDIRMLVGSWSTGVVLRKAFDEAENRHIHRDEERAKCAS